MASSLPSEPDTNLERASSDPSDEDEQSQVESINEESSTPTPTPYRKRKPTHRSKGIKKQNTSGNARIPINQTLQHPQQNTDTASAGGRLPNGPQHTRTPAPQHETPSASDLAPTSTTPNSKPIEDTELQNQQGISTSEIATPNALELTTRVNMETEERGFESHRPTSRTYNRSTSANEKRNAKVQAYLNAKAKRESGGE